MQNRHGKIHFNQRRQKTIWQKHFSESPRPISLPILLQVSLLLLALGLCVLIPFYAPSLWATLSMSTTSTFWWTQNLTLAQIFLLSTRPLILISYWAFPRWAIPKIPHSTSLKSIHYLSQQACFNSYIYSTINCITVHSSFHLANVPRVLQCA